MAATTILVIGPATSDMGIRIKSIETWSGSSSKPATGPKASYDVPFYVSAGQLKYPNGTNVPTNTTLYVNDEFILVVGSNSFTYGQELWWGTPEEIGTLQQNFGNQG